jgi:NAD(P)-dependent dehydrogenase (short-subunit alcohol dehydrogenase family)
MTRSALGLEDKVVVITGGSQGVGYGCGVQFARAGAHVAVVGRRLERAEEAATSLRSFGRDAIAIQADVTQEDDIRRLVEQTLGRFGRIDVAVNNVGGRRGEPEGRLLDSGPEYWRKTFELNLYSVLACSQAFARTMIDGGSPGVIVNIGSVSGFKASPGLAPYGASKAGLVQLTKTLAAELAPHGIRVNAVAPGMVDTESLREYLDDEQLAARAKRVPAGRIATPDDIGKAVVLMASDLSSWIYGRTLVADGGELLSQEG